MTRLIATGKWADIRRSLEEFHAMGIIPAVRDLAADRAGAVILQFPVRS